MDTTIQPINYLNAGVTRQPDGTTVFRVWAPFRQVVALRLGDNDIPMNATGHGYWEAKVTDIQPGTPYWYILDEDLRRPDPASYWQPEGVHGPSFIAASNFTFTDHDWKGIAPEKLVIYELHTGTFSPEGTFDGIRQRLPYLKDLGITAIELMPVAQFPGNRNWGYDGVFPFAVQNSYGTPDDLKALVNAAHKAGLGVILDVVYNHLGPEGNYLRDFGPYFTDKYKTPWGDAINFDGPYCDAVRGFFIQNALRWLDEFHIDALRMDAVHAYFDSSAVHFTAELATAVRDLETRCGRRKLLIGEIDLNDPRYVSPPLQGGYGLDGQWVDEFHHALHALLTGEQQGYYEDFGSLEALARSFSDVYVYTGQYSVHRKRRFGKKPEGLPFHQFVVFSQNHDQVGNRLLGDRLSANLPVAALKLAAAAVILSPFIPLLFMGEEYGEKNPFRFFTSHSDPDLVKAVKEGRQQEFAHEGTAPDPQAEETFNGSKLSWNIQDETSAAILSFYKTLLQLRQSRPALQNTAREATTVYFREQSSLLVLERSAKEERLLLAFNLGSEVQSFVYENNGRLREILNSSVDAAPAKPPASGEIAVPPMSVVVYEIGSYGN
ncbi:maltooligosyl trehalose hydrolase [Chitinophaga terrae (ex Kim and Jung 2007)]|uniref:Malto-oligosyltrehalose trehalohydrolase n=1 Tax=Chitinophaga terrae (ex Kim and Jung 2007) TaxID=408074 RepID=A0A1H3WWC8_9BACT|nr:malto-oligosyltrehalose trehalohydrolase [Chitinophaga terrae (ex Kim and Jung 2007)]GEP90308.1 malto-oligosyltrehalose trehalohydrolase [Chitinophaga terrae (ex Kim and Jung 2007)]SDZ90694.1 maltooligosyl trehalose hydrolase [Chitinophaga terrae (ex Kim and Jung 2007)]